MRKFLAILLLLGLAACDLSTEAETRNDGDDFVLRANWSAALTPVGTATVRGDLAISEYLGSHFNAAASITGGAPNTAYQWRIFRGDCATTTVAANNITAAGLLLYATVQSYPDITTNTTGAASIERFMAGALDSLTAYSVRVRLGQASTNWNGTNPLACGNLQRS